jgi:hypothetical protein
MTHGNESEKRSGAVPHIKAEDLAFNVWLSLLDQLLERKVPMSNAMLYAGQRLQEKQKEHEDKLFYPLDLYTATEKINLLLRRRPEYQQRSRGWSKESLPVGYDD